MKKLLKNPVARSIASVGVLGFALGGAPIFAVASCAPCSSRSRNSKPASSPCAARNPCAAKSQSSPRNPCAAAPGETGTKVDRKQVTRPSNYKPYQASQNELVNEGERLWKDTKLSGNGLTCNSCHQNHSSFSPTFANKYPHPVAMATAQAGVKEVHLDEMIQFCMVVPMSTKPLGWESKSLAALTSYVATLQTSFRPPASPAINPSTGRK